MGEVEGGGVFFDECVEFVCFWCVGGGGGWGRVESVVKLVDVGVFVD